MQAYGHQIKSFICPCSTGVSYSVLHSCRCVRCSAKAYSKQQWHTVYNNSLEYTANGYSVQIMCTFYCTKKVYNVEQRCLVEKRGVECTAEVPGWHVLHRHVRTCLTLALALQGPHTSVHTLYILTIMQHAHCTLHHFSVLMATPHCLHNADLYYCTLPTTHWTLNT